MTAMVPQLVRGEEVVVLGVVVRALPTRGRTPTTSWTAESQSGVRRDVPAPSGEPLAPSTLGVMRTRGPSRPSRTRPPRAGSRPRPSPTIQPRATHSTQPMPSTRGQTRSIPRSTTHHQPPRAPHHVLPAARSNLAPARQRQHLTRNLPPRPATHPRTHVLADRRHSPTHGLPEPRKHLPMHPATEYLWKRPPGESAAQLVDPGRRVPRVLRVVVRALQVLGVARLGVGPGGGVLGGGALVGDSGGEGSGLLGRSLRGRGIRRSMERRRIRTRWLGRSCWTNCRGSRGPGPSWPMCWRSGIFRTRWPMRCWIGSPTSG